MTDKNKHIEDLFIRSKHKVEEMPRKEAWMRLENRLNNRKARPYFKVAHYLSAASVVLAIVGSVFILQKYHQQTQNPVVAENHSTTTVSTPAPEVAVEKAQEDKSTVALKTESSAKQNTNSAKANQPVVTTSSSQTFAWSSSTPDVAKNNNSFADIVTNKEEIKDVNFYVDVPAPMTYDSKTGALDSTISDVYSVTSSAPVAEKETRKKSKASIDLNPKLAPFEWLLGNWKNGEVFDGVNYEVWEKKNSVTLEGSGYFIKDRDTLFQEKITLVTDRDKVYLITAMDNHNRRIKYKLVYMNGTRYTFEQTYDADLPKNVVIERKSANEFSTDIYYPSDKTFTNDQIIYMNSRNLIANNRAFRNLRRN